MINKFLAWLKLEGRSSLTVKNYEIDLRQLSEFLAKEKNIDINNIEVVKIEDMEEYKAKLINKGLAPTSINRKISSLKEFYKYLKSHKYIEENIMLDVSFVKDKREKEIPFLNVAEAEELMNAATNTKSEKKHSKCPEFANIRNELLIKIAIQCGLRNAELSGLTVNSIDSKGKIKVVGKRDKIRYVYLNAEDMKLYKKYLRVREDIVKEDNNIFLSIRGKKLNTIDVGRIIKDCINNTNIDNDKKEKITPHKLRHTCASNLILNGVAIPTVSKLLGHNKVTTTMDFYVHSSNEEVKEICQNSIYNNRKCQ